MLLRGKHLMLTVYGMRRGDVDSIDAICDAVEDWLDLLGVTILDQSFVQFPYQGHSVVWVLGESHLSIHTVPEDGGFFLDLFTCGNIGEFISDECENVFGVMGVKYFISRLHDYLGHEGSFSCKYCLMERSKDE